MNVLIKNVKYSFVDESGDKKEGIWEGNIDKFLSDDVIVILRDVHDLSKLYKVRASILRIVNKEVEKNGRERKVQTY